MTEEVKSRKDRPTGSTHFGDSDFNEENVEEIGDATWGEVLQACCIHSPMEWLYILFGLVLVCFFLYFFLLGLNLLGSSAKVMGGCTAGALFGDQTNPVAGIMIGILATVLIQSSSSTTSIIVSLVPDVISVKAGIFMVMGANIGTSVTNTIVAMGHLGDGDELERAFSAATVHDMFNFLSVGVLFPVELITHYLYYLTKTMLPDSVADGDKWEGPIKKIVSPLGAKIIIANKSVSKAIAKDELVCDDLYPVVCEGGVVSKETCSVGLIACDKKTGQCPAFFQDGASRRDDEVSGGVCFFLSLVILVICLIGLVTVLQKMLLGLSTRIIYKATNINGYFAMVIGAGITILVQSSSITTSALTPFAGIGAIHLEQMLPLTLGANIGTTVTGLLASLVSSSVKSLQVALCHLFFNISGILIWYPIPFMRNVPLNAARALGKTTRVWRGFPIVYLIIVFGLIPMTLFGLSVLFEEKKTGLTILGSFIVAILGCLIILTIYKWYRGNLKENVIAKFDARQKKSSSIQSLPEDMKELKDDIVALKEHVGMAVKQKGQPAQDMSPTEGGMSLVIFLITAAILLSATIFGLVMLFVYDSKGLTALGAFLTIAIGLGLIFAALFYKTLKDNFTTKMEERKRTNDALATLEEDMDEVEKDIAALKESTSMTGEESGTAAIDLSKGHGKTAAVNRLADFMEEMKAEIQALKIHTGMPGAEEKFDEEC